MGGLMLTETEFDHRVIAEMIPMRDLFATLFFVSVGMLLDIGFIMRNLPAVLGMALFIMLVKVLATTFVLAPFKLGAKTIAFTALGMVSLGEFNYVLAHVGRTSGAIPAELYNLILSASLLTIVFTPAAFWVAPRVGKTMLKIPVLGHFFAPQTHVPGEIDVLENHAIVIGYGRVGQRMARGMRQAGVPVVVIDQDLNLVREVAASGVLTVYGDASYENVLAAAHPAKARVIVVALPDFGATRAVVHRARDTNPDVLIVARAQRAENDVKLREAGATAVVVPEIAGSLMLLEETLLLMGLPHDHIFTGLSTLPRLESVPVEPDSNRDSASDPQHVATHHTI
jgi:CPA2 family monovalent cation:H+ antiporter-2